MELDVSFIVIFHPRVPHSRLLSDSIKERQFNFLSTHTCLTDKTKPLDLLTTRLFP